MRAGPLPVDVQAAAIQQLAAVAFVLLCVAGRVREGQPHARRLVRLDAFTAHVRVEQATRPQADIADDFGIESEAGPAREQSVLRILDVLPEARPA